MDSFSEALQLMVILRNTRFYGRSRPAKPIVLRTEGKAA